MTANDCAARKFAVLLHAGLTNAEAVERASDGGRLRRALI